MPLSTQICRPRRPEPAAGCARPKLAACLLITVLLVAGGCSNRSVNVNGGGNSRGGGAVGLGIGIPLQL